jgi:hypothetical protein
MTIEEANVAIYRQYDKIIALTLREMTKHFTPDGSLHLIDFDQDNVEHMYALRIALMARDLWQVKVTVDSTWLKWRRLNWKLRKGFDKVGRTPAGWVRGMIMPEFLDGVRAIAKEQVGVEDDFDFSTIYKLYYEGK